MQAGQKAMVDASPIVNKPDRHALVCMLVFFKASIRI